MCALQRQRCTGEASKPLSTFQPPSRAASRCHAVSRGVTRCHPDRRPGVQLIARRVAVRCPPCQPVTRQVPPPSTVITSCIHTASIPMIATLSFRASKCAPPASYLERFYIQRCGAVHDRQGVKYCKSVTGGRERGGGGGGGGGRLKQDT